MIKNVLVPEKIGSHYLFAKRVVGFHIDGPTVHATQLYLKGAAVTIEQTFTEQLSAQQEFEYDEQVSQAIQNILQKVGKYDAVYTAMSGAQVIFKTLKLPFATYEKIKMVVNYEVEPLLPFALDDAVIDFIITKQDTQEGSSEVIVAAVQKFVIAEQISFFEQIGVHPQKVSVDLFELYNLYQHIPEYAQQKGEVALLDIGYTATRVAFIQDGSLTAVRVLPQGVKQLEQGEPQDGFEKFWSKVQFTLNSFAGQQELKISKFIFSGKGAKIAGLLEFFADASSAHCELFQTKHLFSDGSVKIKPQAVLSIENLTSLGLVLPSTITGYFNLLPEHMSVDREVSLLTKQLVFAGIFFVLLLGGLLAHNILQGRKLRRELAESKEDVVMVLKEKFRLSGESDDFDTVLEDAEGIVKKDEATWAPFTDKSQFLQYLLELMYTLDTENLGLEIERLTISNGDMTLQARVKGFPELAKFENELRRSKLFKYTGSAQNPDFTMKIPLAKRR